ncbi:metal-dependent hydrolase [Candidatus Woesearchaeota archaeon]|nr:metal-dependent hydrolase [Candidatus Woesearchaeota archaeon]
MMFKTHLAFSFLCSIILWPFLSGSNIPKWAFVLVFILSSVIPDIDCNSSVLGKRVKVIGWIFAHRGIFHSIFPAILISTPLLIFFGAGYALASFTGYLSHLVLDMLNHQGVGLFFPLSRWRIKGFMKSGGLAERLLFVLFFVGIFIMMFLSKS